MERILSVVHSCFSWLPFLGLKINPRARPLSCIWDNQLASWLLWSCCSIWLHHIAKPNHSSPPSTAESRFQLGLLCHKESDFSNITSLLRPLVPRPRLVRLQQPRRPAFSRQMFLTFNTRTTSSRRRCVVWSSRLCNWRRQTRSQAAQLPASRRPWPR